MYGLRKVIDKNEKRVDSKAAKKTKEIGVGFHRKGLGYRNGLRLHQETND